MIVSSELCEFLAAFAVAAGAWIFGYCWFILGHESPASPKTEFLPDKTEEEAKQFKPDFLLDLIRWAELLQDKIDDALRSYERKALLMVSAALAAMGYLYLNPGGFEESRMIWELSVYVAFSAVAVLGVKTIDFLKFHPSGEHPSNFHEILKQKTPADRNYVLYYMLDAYRVKIDENRTSITRKYNYLHKAKYFFISGISGFLGMAFESGEWVADICVRLAP